MTSLDIDNARTPVQDFDWRRVRDARHCVPESIAEALRVRRRRPLVEGDGRLFIVAADHPARGALAAGRNPMAMADRYALLERLVLALSRPGVDGVLGTPDILDDLALLDALDNKIAIGSMNRGGLRGAVFEYDDRFTGYNVDAIRSARLDAAKLLLRIDLADRASVRTLEAAAQAVSSAACAELPILIEPFLSRRKNGCAVNDLSADAVITSVAIASGLGASSAFSWLKLPVVPEMERVMSATTLPTLLLGGDAGMPSDDLFASWESALRLPGVHGVVAGRTLLFPENDDVTAAVDTAAETRPPVQPLKLSLPQTSG